MLRVVTTGKFDKEYLLMHRRGKDLSKLETVMLMLAEEKPLPVQLRDHPLKGNFKDAVTATLNLIGFSSTSMNREP